MHLSTLFAVATVLAGAVAAPVREARHVLHEKRSSIPHGWSKREKLPRELVLPMKIALTQSNLDKLDEMLMDVSQPESENYGQHWDHNKIANTFRPSKETHDTVRQWLEDSGIAKSTIKLSKSHGWLHFEATIQEAEDLLKTKYYMYEHLPSNTPHAAVEEYHVPEHISKHVDFITPTLHFDPQVITNPRKLKKRAALPTKIVPGAARNIVNPANLPKKGATLGSVQSILTELEQCDEYITPVCLETLYEIPPVITGGGLQKNPFGIVEYTPESYLQSDLNMFFANFSKAQKQNTPTAENIDGGSQQKTQLGFEYQGEPSLDFEYGMTLVNPIPVQAYQVGGNADGASFNNFLDAIDGSYCTFEGGDDPTQDATYPNTAPGGYDGPEACGTFAPTKVISTSYGYNEADLTPFYEERQCAEYAKLGLAGTTVAYSSGDYGVAGNGGQCIDPVTRAYNNGTSGLFNPSFPGGCPYVTSVGATQIKPGASVTAPEEACETVIYSGGGFSNVFPLPSYQESAVANYYAKYNPPYGADRYNNSRMVRAYPDVSANGANYVISADGSFTLAYGTSASAPVFSAIITIINEARAAIGKGSVGFINPTIYANPSAFNDITSGGNQGCGTPGFTAVPGWDPVTGLGTPNTSKLLEVFLGLG